MYKKYSKELKLEVVTRKLAGESTKKLVSEYNLSNNGMVNLWVEQYKNGNTTFEETRGKATKKDAPSKGRKKIVRRENMTVTEYIEYLEIQADILKKIYEVEALSGSTKHSKYKVILELSNKYPITSLCNYLDASTSTFYLFKKRNPEKYDTNIMNLICEIHTKRLSSGYRTVQMILKRKYNIVVNHKKIIRIMPKLNIKGSNIAENILSIKIYKNQKRLIM